MPSQIFYKKLHFLFILVLRRNLNSNKSFKNVNLFMLIK